jgi:hypothetical protein
LRRILPTDDEDDDAAAANDEANHKDQPAKFARFIESSLRLEEPFLRPNPPFLRPNPGQRRAAPFLDDTERERTPDTVTSRLLCRAHRGSRARHPARATAPVARISQTGRFTNPIVAGVCLPPLPTPAPTSPLDRPRSDNHSNYRNCPFPAGTDARHPYSQYRTCTSPVGTKRRKIFPNPLQQPSSPPRGQPSPENQTAAAPGKPRSPWPFPRRQPLLPDGPATVGTNIIRFIKVGDIPEGRKATYLRICSTDPPQHQDRQHRHRLCSSNRIISLSNQLPIYKLIFFY